MTESEARTGWWREFRSIPWVIRTFKLSCWISIVLVSSILLLILFLERPWIVEFLLAPDQTISFVDQVPDPTLKIYDEIGGTKYEQYWERFYENVFDRPSLAAMKAQIDMEEDIIGPGFRDSQLVPESFVFIVILIDILWVGSIIAAVNIASFSIWLVTRLSAGFQRMAFILYPVVLLVCLVVFSPSGGWGNLFRPNRWQYFFDGSLITDTLIPVALTTLVAMAAFPFAVRLFEWVSAGFRQ